MIHWSLIHLFSKTFLTTALEKIGYTSSRENEGMKYFVSFSMFYIRYNFYSLNTFEIKLKDLFSGEFKLGTGIKDGVLFLFDSKQTQRLYMKFDEKYLKPTNIVKFVQYDLVSFEGAIEDIFVDVHKDIGYVP